MGRPPTPDELSTVCQLLRDWEREVAKGRARQEFFDDFALKRDVPAWFVYWFPAETLWWTDNPGREFGAFGLAGEADEEHFAWLVPQGEDGRQLKLLVVTTPDRGVPRVGPVAGEALEDGTPFGPILGTRRGERARPVVNELWALVPWLTELDAESMAKLKSVPGCEERGFNIHAVTVSNEEREEWFCYEVYRLGKARRENIIGVIEALDEPLVFVAPPDGG